MFRPSFLESLLAATLFVAGCTSQDELYDFDGDGSLDTEDCAPQDGSIYPGADDPWGDGIDADCDGADGVDRDGDGFPANVPAGDPFLDCDDNNPLVNPGAFDLISDGADRNCDGHAGIDGDDDGYASLVSEGLDCDDTDAAINPGVADPYGDTIDQDCSDGDGVDADGDSFPAEDPDYVGDPVAWDCNDGNAQVHPGAFEIEGDGIDNDCDGFDAADSDQDGHVSDEAGGDDCDDAEPSTFPGAPEQADGADNDCDGTVDEGTSLYDDDEDGFSEVQGDCDDTNVLLSPVDADEDGFSLCDADCDDTDPFLTPSDLDQDGFSSCEGDCDDFNPLVNPSAPEICNLTDDNCDGVQTDEQDDDGDGDPQCTDCNDNDPAANTLDADSDNFDTCTGGDCDDSNALANPFASDAIGDGNDQNCDGVDGIDSDGDLAASVLSGGTDCDDTDPALNQDDADGDGSSTCGADAQTGTADDDCDDSNDSIHPGAVDLCDDGVDQDCDDPFLAFETDDDGDGFSDCAGDCNDADPALTPEDADGDGSSSCAGDCDDSDVTLNLADADTDGYSTCTGDCDDLNPAVSPGAIELCNLIDDNCDGLLLTEEADDDSDGDPQCTDCDDNDSSATTLDADGDNFDTCTGGDCDDNNALFFPINLDPFGDGFDTNCDGTDGIDSDGDGFASNASGGTDCDDADAAINPSAAEIPDNSVDEDCDGLLGTDSDGDGYTSLLTGGDDCDDSDDSVYPGFFEDPNDGADANCDGADGNNFLAFTGTASNGYGDGAAWAPRSVATCDLDGDGFLDLAVGAPWWNATSGSGNEGLVGVWYGPVTSGGGVASAPTRLRGVNMNSFVGYSLACLGDTDGDGAEELAIGAPGDIFTGSPSTGGEGIVFIVQGVMSGEVLLDGESPSLDYTRLFPGPSSDSSDVIGYWLDSGDFDGDGIPDLMVGGWDNSYPQQQWPPEPVYGWSGSDLPTAFIVPGPITDLTQVGPGQAAIQAPSTEVVGNIRPFASAGDTNGDGVDDLLMSLPHSDPSALGGDAGAVYLFLGPFSGTLSVGAAQAEILGSYYDQQAGFQIDGLGDLNGDGYDDIGVTSPGPYTINSYHGVHVFFGPVNGTVQMEFADAIIGIPDDGSSLDEPTVAGAGDVNGDGLGDLVVAFSSHYSITTGTNTFGGARVVYGPFGGDMDLFGAGTEPLGDEGELNTDFRTCAARTADLDGDGFPDPVVLRPSVDDSVITSVRVYINPHDP